MSKRKNRDRQAVLRSLANYAATKPEVTTNIASKLGVDEQTVLDDLRAIEADADVEDILDELEAELRAVRTFDALFRFQKKLLVACASGRIALEDAESLLAASRELRENLATD